MENIFAGQNPNKKDKSKLRIVKPIYLKNSAFAYDLWEFKKNKKEEYELSSLYYEGMRVFINSKGFYKKQLTNDNHIYIKEIDNVIEEVTPEFINDLVRGYVESIGDIKFKYYNEDFSIPHSALKNTYLKQHQNIVNNKWLTNIQIHSKPILKDTETSSFFVFNNCYVEVTKEGITKKNIEELKGYCVWKDQIKPYDFNYKNDTKGEYEKFINNVCNNDDQRFKAFRSAIGYLLHDYFNPTKGQAVLFYDEALTTSDKPNGGTGKGATVNGLKILRPTAKIDGKNYKSDDKFKWSNVTPSTQIVWIDETNKNFQFNDMFSCLTDGWQIERKHQNKFDIPPEESPKVVICSNVILENKGTSNKRRQFIIEFSDYYSKRIVNGTETPIADEHGILFSKDWSVNEWNLFFSFMFDCLKLYLKEGLIEYQSINVDLNLLKQQTCDEFIEYITNNPPPLNTRIEIKNLFEPFKSSYLGEDSNFKQRTFTNWLDKYCAVKNLMRVKVSDYNGNPIYELVTK